MEREGWGKKRENELQGFLDLNISMMILAVEFRYQ